MKKTILCLLCLLWGMAAGAQENLVRGKRYYENRNYAAALPLLQDAAKEGYGEACYLLGRMYDFGLGVEQNYPIALRMFQRGLEYGYELGESELGGLYEWGDGCTADAQKAFDYYQRSHARGVLSGTFNLARCYYYGKGVAEDNEKAFGMLHALVRNDEFRFDLTGYYRLACRILGECYHKGFGTVETNGNNITIKNSRLSNGKQVVRSFSSTNVSIVNSMLSNARNFLLTIGSNDYIKADLLKEYEFTLLNGEKITSTINNYLMKSNAGDDTLNAFVIGSFTDKEKMRKAILDIQNALNDESLIKDIYKGSMNIKDTMFYRSGIASIGMDTMFNGPFLESSTPSVVNMLLTGLNVPYIPNHVGGMSYPVELNITGKTKFYDYKEWNNLDITGLINENISSFVDDAKEIFGVTDANIGDISIFTSFALLIPAFSLL